MMRMRVKKTNQMYQRSRHQSKELEPAVGAEFRPRQASGEIQEATKHHWKACKHVGGPNDDQAGAGLPWGR